MADNNNRRARELLDRGDYDPAVKLYAHHYSDKRTPVARRMFWVAEDARAEPTWYGDRGKALVGLLDQLGTDPTALSARTLTTWAVDLEKMAQIWPGATRLTYLAAEIDLLAIQADLRQPAQAAPIEVLIQRANAATTRLTPILPDAPDLRTLQDDVQSRLRTTRPLAYEPDPIPGMPESLQRAHKLLESALETLSVEPLGEATRLAAQDVTLQRRIEQVRSELEQAEKAIRRAQIADELELTNPGRPLQRYRRWREVSTSVSSANGLSQKVAQLEQELVASLRDRISRLKQSFAQAEAGRDLSALQALNEELDTIRGTTEILPESSGLGLREQVRDISSDLSRLIQQLQQTRRTRDGEIAQLRQKFEQALDQNLSMAGQYLAQLKDFGRQGEHITDLDSLEQRLQERRNDANRRTWVQEVSQQIDAGDLAKARGRIDMRQKDSEEYSPDQQRKYSNEIKNLRARLDQAVTRKEILDQIVGLEQSGQVLGTTRLDELRKQAHNAGLQPTDQVFEQLSRLKERHATLARTNAEVRQLYAEISLGGDLKQMLKKLGDLRQLIISSPELALDVQIEQVDQLEQSLRAPINDKLAAARFAWRDPAQRTEAERLLAEAEALAPEYESVRDQRRAWLRERLGDLLNDEERRLADLKRPVDQMITQFWSAERNDQNLAQKDARRRVADEHAAHKIEEARDIISKLPPADPQVGEFQQRLDELRYSRARMRFNLAICAYDLTWFAQLVNEEHPHPGSSSTLSAEFIALRDALQSEKEALDQVRQRQWSSALSFAEQARSQAGSVGARRTDRLVRDLQQAQSQAAEIEQKLSQLANAIATGAGLGEHQPEIIALQTRLQSLPLLVDAYENDLDKRVLLPYRERWVVQARQALEQIDAPSAATTLDQLYRIAPNVADLDPPAEQLQARAAVARAREALDSKRPRSARQALANVPQSYLNDVLVSKMRGEIDLRLQKASIKRGHAQHAASSEERQKLEEALQGARQAYEQDSEDDQTSKLISEIEAKLQHSQREADVASAQLPARQALAAPLPAPGADRIAAIAAAQERLNNIRSANLDQTERRSVLDGCGVARNLEQIHLQIVQQWAHELEQARKKTTADDRAQAVDRAVPLLHALRLWDSADRDRAELKGENPTVRRPDLKRGVELAVSGQQAEESLLLLAPADKDADIRSRLISGLCVTPPGIKPPPRFPRWVVPAGLLTIVGLIIWFGTSIASGGGSDPISTPTAQVATSRTATAGSIAIGASKTPSTTPDGRSTSTPTTVRTATPTPTLEPSFTPVPPTATPARPTSIPVPTKKLRVSKMDDNGSSDCIAMRIVGIDTSGWYFLVNGVAVNGVQIRGNFQGGDARACGLSPGQVVTISILNAQGKVVPGGGATSNGGANMYGEWK